MSREYRTKPGTSRDPPSVKDKPMSDVPRPPSALPPPVSDEAWELASAYLDNEVTPDERAQVESSPMLLALVDQLRPAVNSIREPVTIDTTSRELTISAALDSADAPGEPVAAPANVRSIETARSSKAKPQSNNRWLAPVAAAAAVVAIVGVGSAVFSRQSSNKATTASEPQSAATTMAAAAQQPAAPAATTKAGDTTTTASPVALDNTNAPTTAAAAPPTTQIAAAATTAPAATTSPATTSAPKSASSAASTTTAPAAPAIASGGPVSQVEADELRRYLGTSYRQTFSPLCPAPGDAPLAVGTIDWRGQPATVFVNEGRTAVVVIVDEGCVRAGALTV
jgi:hypothetical protein